MIPPDHDRRVEAARRRSQWELGSPVWASVILHAYWNPDDDAQDLDDED